MNPGVTIHPVDKVFVASTNLDGQDKVNHNVDEYTIIGRALTSEFGERKPGCQTQDMPGFIKTQINED